MASLSSDEISDQQRRIIFDFKTRNPTMGVRKVVDALRPQIPLITGKMVRCVQVEVAPPAPDPAKQLDLEGMNLRAARRQRTAKKMKARLVGQKDPTNLEKEDIFWCSEDVADMYWDAGKTQKGNYPLLANGDTQWDSDRVLWVNVVPKDTEHGDEFVMFEMLQMKATSIPTPQEQYEAVWMLWKMLKKARDETPGGKTEVSDLAISQQLLSEYGIDPMDVDLDMQMRNAPLESDLAGLFRKLVPGVVI